MKKLILASAVLFAMTACDDSSSSSTNGYTCNVSRTDNTVTLYETHTRGTYKQTQTVYGDHSIFTTDITYSSSAEAAEDCAEEKEEAREWRDGSYQVECTSNSVHVTQRDDSNRSSMDETVREFQYICDEGYIRAQNGTLDDYD